MSPLSLITVEVEDFISAAQTIPLGDISTCKWISNWTSAEKLLSWAKRGLEEGDEYGLSNAISYAKQSLCCRVDILVRYNHLVKHFQGNYPQKIEALQKIGVNIPKVVQRLVIDPRNVFEHHYSLPKKEEIIDAVEISELLIQATETEYNRSSIIAVNWNAMGMSSSNLVKFEEFDDDKIMLFIDVFENPAKAKIVDPINREIRYVEMKQFTYDQSIQLSQILRRNYSNASLGGWGHSPYYYQEMKKQAGF
ncbi:MAG: hypothetical protein WCO49_20330 [Nostocales cyanobacterium ELA608]|jgi:hypothetical protein